MLGGERSRGDLEVVYVGYRYHSKFAKLEDISLNTARRAHEKRRGTLKE
jgi:hypothetical protein